MRNKNNFLHR